jgi:hypothetical protein
MPTFVNPSNDDLTQALTVPPAARELPGKADPNALNAILAALNSDRPIQVIFPGEIGMDADGEPLVTESRSYMIGEATPLES